MLVKKGNFMYNTLQSGRSGMGDVMIMLNVCINRTGVLTLDDSKKEVAIQVSVL